MSTYPVISLDVAHAEVGIEKEVVARGLLCDVVSVFEVKWSASCYSPWDYSLVSLREV